MGTDKLFQSLSLECWAQLDCDCFPSFAGDSFYQVFCIESHGFQPQSRDAWFLTAYYLSIEAQVTYHVSLILVVHVSISSNTSLKRGCLYNSTVCCSLTVLQFSGI